MVLYSMLLVLLPAAATHQREGGGAETDRIFAASRNDLIYAVTDVERWERSKLLAVKCQDSSLRLRVVKEIRSPVIAPGEREMTGFAPEKLVVYRSSLVNALRHFRNMYGWYPEEVIACLEETIGLEGGTDPGPAAPQGAMAPDATEVLRSAIDALACHRGTVSRPAIDKLIELLRRPATPWALRRSCIDAMRRLGGVRMVELVPDFVALLDPGSPHYRSVADCVALVPGIGKHARARDLVVGLRRVLKEEKDDGAARLSAARALGKFREFREPPATRQLAVAALIEALRPDEEFGVRRAAAVSLGELGPDYEAAKGLVGALLDGDPDLVEHATYALEREGRVGHRERVSGLVVSAIVKALREALADGDPATRERVHPVAVRILRGYGDLAWEARADLVHALIHNPAARADASAAIVQIRTWDTEQIRPLIDAMADHPEPPVRAAASDCLWKLARGLPPHDALPLLTRFSEVARKADPATLDNAYLGLFDICGSLRHHDLESSSLVGVIDALEGASSPKKSAGTGAVLEGFIEEFKARFNREFTVLGIPKSWWTWILLVWGLLFLLTIVLRLAKWGGIVSINEWINRNKGRDSEYIQGVYIVLCILFFPLRRWRNARAVSSWVGMKTTSVKAWLGRPGAPADFRVRTTRGGDFVADWQARLPSLADKGEWGLVVIGADATARASFASRLARWAIQGYADDPAPGRPRVALGGRKFPVIIGEGEQFQDAKQLRAIVCEKVGKILGADDPITPLLLDQLIEHRMILVLCDLDHHGNPEVAEVLDETFRHWVLLAGTEKDAKPAQGFRSVTSLWVEDMPHRVAKLVARKSCGTEFVPQPVADEDIDAALADVEGEVAGRKPLSQEERREFRRTLRDRYGLFEDADSPDQSRFAEPAQALSLAAEQYADELFHDVGAGWGRFLVDAGRIASSATPAQQEALRSFLRMTFDLLIESNRAATLTAEQRKKLRAILGQAAAAATAGVAFS